MKTLKLYDSICYGDQVSVGEAIIDRDERDWTIEVNGETIEDLLKEKQ
jgi:hypothetical protein